MVSALDRFTIGSARSPERLVTVYAPDNAETSPGRRPLLLLHDGQNLFDADRAHVPGQHWRVAETAGALVEAGRLPPILIAGIDHLGPDRIREFTPTPGDRQLGGGLAGYGRFLVEDLVPDLCRRFPGRIDVTNLAMGGSSLGGLATLGIARQFPGRFGRLLIMSPSVWWDRRVILRRLRRVGLPSRSRVWLDIGAHEGARALADVRALRDELVSLKVDLHYLEDPDGEHSEAAWGRRLGAALEWMYADDGYDGYDRYEMTLRLARILPVILVVLCVAQCGRGRQATPATANHLDPPFPVQSFAAVDIDGHDRSPDTWGDKVVIINAWATWCAPCRHEIPALSALQNKYADRVLVIGLLQDQISTDGARVFATSVGMNYPIVRSTHEIEQRWPEVLALPMTFVVDGSRRLVTMYAGEIDPAEVERDVVRLLAR